jgi:Fe-S-cluster containining protein
VKEENLVAKLLRLYDAVDTRNAHAQTVCEKGCAACCTDDFDVHFPEFLTILDFLGIGSEGCFNRTTHQPFAQLSEEWTWRVKGTCIFLDQQEQYCKIYAVRPLLCRNYGAVLSFTDFSCPLMKAFAAQCKLIVEADVPPIDTVTNRIIIEGTTQKMRPAKALPLTLWFNNIQSDGVLRTERMRDLLATATNRTVDEFITVFTKQ